MKTRKLGRTALSLSELSFGAAGIGNLYRSVSREDAMETPASAISIPHPITGRAFPNAASGIFFRGNHATNSCCPPRSGGS